MKRKSYEDEQRELAEATRDPRSPEARAALVLALGSKRSLVAARAARLIKEHHLDGFERELADVFTRFLRDPIKSDPSCHAKLAAIEALDYGESSDAETFLVAVRTFQPEGGDTAGPLRARGAMALARLGHPDFDLVAATLINDALPTVRQAAIDALVHRGDRAGAPLALCKLIAGDEDPLVTLAAMSALLTLAPAWGRKELGAMLDGEGERRELAAVALGQSRDDESLSLLLAALEDCALSAEREALFRGIGLHRSDRALAALLEVIGDGAPGDATVAIAALSPRRFEPGVADTVRAAAAANARADLAAALAESFPA